MKLHTISPQKLLAYPKKFNEDYIKTDLYTDNDTSSSLFIKTRESKCTMTTMPSAYEIGLLMHTEENYKPEQKRISQTPSGSPVKPGFANNNSADSPKNNSQNTQVFTFNVDETLKTKIINFSTNIQQEMEKNQYRPLRIHSAKSQNRDKIHKTHSKYNAYSTEKKLERNLEKIRASYPAPLIIPNPVLNHSITYLPLSVTKKKRNQSEYSIQKVQEISFNSASPNKSNISTRRSRVDLSTKIDQPNRIDLLTQSKYTNVTSKIAIDISKKFKTGKKKVNRHIRSISNSQNPSFVIKNPSYNPAPDTSATQAAAGTITSILGISTDQVHEYRPDLKYRITSVDGKPRLVFYEDGDRIIWKTSSHYFDEKLSKFNKKPENISAPMNPQNTSSNVTNDKKISPKKNNQLNRPISLNSKLTLQKICGFNNENNE